MNKALIIGGGIGGVLAVCGIGILIYKRTQKNKSIKQLVKDAGLTKDGARLMYNCLMGLNEVLKHTGYPEEKVIAIYEDAYNEVFKKPVA
jgi:nitrate reductase gamma subunit